MTTVAFAVPPPSLLPESLARAMLNPDIAMQSAQKDPTPAEGLSLVLASRREDIVSKTPTVDAKVAPVRAEPPLEQPEKDVMEVELSNPLTPHIEILTNKQLKAYAAEKGVSLQGLNTKKQMVQKLKAEL